VLWKERVRTVECLGNLEKKRCKAKEGWFHLTDFIIDKVVELTAHTLKQTKQPQLIHRFKDSILQDSNAWYSLDTIDLLKEAIALLRELQDMEPDSKCK
jgi:hypothetical protein